MPDGLTFGSGVVSDLMFGTLLRHDPRKVFGLVAIRVTLEAVVEFTDVIWVMCAQYLGPSYMRDLLTSLRHGDVYDDLKARGVVDCAWLSEPFLQTSRHVK
jgi:hypothetical protein